METTKQSPPKKRRRRKSRGKPYFTQVHEDAIVAYANTDDIKKRTEQYVKYIGPVFDEMVDKIVYTYKFTNLPNIDSLRDECKIWLITVLGKYDPNKGSKAFSYFSVITKNWFIHKVKKRNKRTRTEIDIDDIASTKDVKYIVTLNPYHKDRERNEFWNLLMSEVDSWEQLKMKETEERVLKAVKILLESAEDIEIFNKKAIYLYLRELTGLNTKQIVNNLNKMRARYRVFKKKYNGGDS